jgi:hypothetical protein
VIRPTGRREVAENVLTAVLIAAATALIDAGLDAVKEAREARRREAERAEKNRKKGKK